ncbi:unnamed protein product [Sphagnum jensenii]|uniref:Uncharacterized protein n=1 Tax=Sphagnum jensenii TaxID=128206 RepID=A0ABP0WSI8_9BRYO
MIHVILRRIKSTAVVVFQSSRTRIPSRTKSLGLISADPRSRNQRTHIKRSDGVSLGHETVTYGGPEARGTPGSCLPTAMITQAKPSVPITPAQTIRGPS